MYNMPYSTMYDMKFFRDLCKQRGSAMFIPKQGMKVKNKQKAKRAKR